MLKHRSVEGTPLNAYPNDNGNGTMLGRESVRIHSTLSAVHLPSELKDNEGRMKCYWRTILLAFEAWKKNTWIYIYEYFIVSSSVNQVDHEKPRCFDMTFARGTHASLPPASTEVVRAVEFLRFFFHANQKGLNQDSKSVWKSTLSYIP